MKQSNEILTTEALKINAMKIFLITLVLNSG